MSAGRAALRVVSTVAGPGSTVDAAALRSAFRLAPAGLAIITTALEGRPVGLTVTSLRSLSAEPALITFSITRTASTWPTFARAEGVLVHLLDERHRAAAVRFATSGVDRFAAPLRYRTDATGLPRLSEAAVMLRCTVEDRRPYGDADLFVAAVTAVEHDPGSTPPAGPLVYHGGGFHLLQPAPEDEA